MLVSLLNTGCMERVSPEYLAEHLLELCEKNHFDEISAREEQLIKTLDILPNITAHDNKSVDLLIALARNERGKVSLLVHDYPQLAKSRVNTTETALMIAAFFGSPETVHELLRAGAQVNEQSLRSGGSALHALVEGGSTLPKSAITIENRKSIARILIEHSIDLTIKDTHAHTAHRLAIRTGQYELADELVACSALQSQIERHNNELRVYQEWYTRLMQLYQSLYAFSFRSVQFK